MRVVPMRVPLKGMPGEHTFALVIELDEGEAHPLTKVLDALIEKYEAENGEHDLGAEWLNDLAFAANVVDDEEWQEWTGQTQGGLFNEAVS